MFSEWGFLMRVSDTMTVTVIFESWRLVLQVRRACGAFAAPKLPDLLVEGLDLIARVPDSRCAYSSLIYQSQQQFSLRRAHAQRRSSKHNMLEVVAAALASLASMCYVVLQSSCIFAPYSGCACQSSRSDVPAQRAVFEL